MSWRMLSFSVVRSRLLMMMPAGNDRTSRPAASRGGAKDGTHMPMVQSAVSIFS